MAHVEERASVLAPIEPVFDLIADHRRALTWLDGFSRFDLIRGPERAVGARVQTEGHVLGVAVSTELEIVEFEPPRLLVSRSDAPIRSLTTWSLAPAESGTVVTFTGDYFLPLGLRFLGDRTIEMVVGNQVRQSLVNLQRIFSVNGASEAGRC